MSEVKVRVRLDLIKKMRSGAFIERWDCIISKPEGWGLADFQPFAIEERVEDGGMVRVARYDLKIESYNPVTNEVFASYEVARSKSWPVTRCLIGCGWSQGLTRKQKVLA